MPSDIETIIGSLDHLIDRMKKIKDDEEINEGGDILLKDIEDNIKKAQRAQLAISEPKIYTVNLEEYERIIKVHYVIVGIALKLMSNDLENSMNVLKKKFNGVSVVVDDSLKTIEQCKQLYTKFCE